MLAEGSVTDTLACAMAVHEVERAVLVTRMDPDDTFATEAAYRKAVAGHEGLFYPFFNVGATDMAAARLERVLVEVGLFFRGIGVVELSLVPADAFSLAAERDLFVAVRRPDSLAELDAAAGDHPGTKIVVMGPDPVDGLADLLRRHARLFVVADAPRADDLDRWLPVVQAAPDRVMWGSGASHPADVEAYGRVVADARAFIAGLPQPMRKPVAVGNARRLLGAPTPPEADA